MLIPGYQLREVIHESETTIIYRATKIQNQTPVLVKTLKTEYPTTTDIAKIKHEYEIVKNLDIPGIAKFYSWQKHNNCLALILEDCGNQSLKKFIASRKIEIIELIKIAIQITESLDQLHINKIIHKDIKPQNIIINTESFDVKIIDFSIASLLPKEMQKISNPNFLEGTLAYMSPEQTGRMNRVIDYRTDFYSLGVTFYEMLTGQLPFQAKDSIELVHCHIAKQPIPPDQLNSEIPKAISDTIIKLLSKTAEERYQSAYGIKADLETCLAQMLDTGKIKKFIPGQQDLSRQLEIPQKLYGRELEVATLMAAFEQVSQGTRGEMLLIAGYSGIGKSALVNEIHKPIVRSRGYFTSGKFDQYKRNIPYASFIQALRGLLQQLLTESDERLQTWKEKLLEAFGANGQVIVDVIPEVELIVGKQPAIVQLGADESQNRFNLVFKNFIHVFAQREHPLVLFLDDLQWADSASLKLIQLLVTASDGRYLFVIGAYRDNEVSPTHPLMLTLNEMQTAGAKVNTIALQPLELNQINQLIADTLKCTLARSQPLAELVLQKTAGNPFFLTQMLAYLYIENFLVLNYATNTWQWNIELLQNIGVTENVVELMISKIQKLPLNTQNVVKLAACIGNRFDLNVLSVVNEKSLSATAVELWEALQSGLILPLADTYKVPLVLDQFEQVVVDYKFLHDRVQQAAYALIPNDQKKQVHLKVGQRLLVTTKRDELEEKIFDIVNHLNIGADLITFEPNKEELASLNLIAGQKAKASAAYEAALNYFKVGISCLSTDSWQKCYELTLTLYVEASEAAYLYTDFIAMENLAGVVLQQAKTLLDRVKVYEVKIQAFIAQNQLLEAVKIALIVLNLLGEGLPKQPNQLQILLGLMRTKLALMGKRIEDFQYLPEMTAPGKLAAMRILSSVTSAAYLAVPQLFALIVFKQVNLSLRYGNTSESAYAYAAYGIILCGLILDIENGYQFGKLALSLLAKANAKELQAKTLVVVNIFIKHWQEHFRETLQPFLEAYFSGLETGDLEYAAWAAFFHCYSSYYIGKELTALEREMAFYSEAISQLKQENQLNYNKIYRQAVLNLLGKSENPCLLVGEAYDESKMLPVELQKNDKTALCYLYIHKMILCYLFHKYEQAVENAVAAEKYINSILATYTVIIVFFYNSLAQLALFLDTSKPEQKRILKKVTANQKKMKKWAKHAPMNYLHKFYLVEAERSRIMGEDAKAMEYYDRAIALVKEQAYIHEEALAHELAAKFYLAKGKEAIAKFYMLDAHYCYLQWGAAAKVKDLEARYPQLISRKSLGITASSMSIATDTLISQTSTISNTCGNKASSDLDLTTVIKASQALASEIVLGKLLEKLIKIMMENAGAQKGFFILNKNEKLIIEAEGMVDRDDVKVLQSIIVNSQIIPESIINYVVRTQQSVVLNDTALESKFVSDIYIKNNKPKSVLCAPILNQGKLIGLLYLENNLVNGAFTPARLEVLKLLSSQAAISLENAILYTKLSEANEQLEDYSRTLEIKVQERTLEVTEKNQLLQQEISDRLQAEKALRQSEAQLREKANQLELALRELQQTQTQLIQTEKMSSLGQMVAGVAHEINNPVNFISGNLSHATEYSQNILCLLQLYQKYYPNLVPEIRELADAIDLNFLMSDLPKLLNSMKVGTERIQEIVRSLRNFSRHDEAQKKWVDLHEGLDSTLLILQHRLQEQKGFPSIQIIKEYGELPVVECYAGQMNQVFMNILSNAIDVLELQTGEWEQGKFSTTNIDENSCLSSQSAMTNHQSLVPTIRIQTEVLNHSWIAIRIADNGPGMTEEVSHCLFDPFFTTKPVGKGTGLGLSISYQIVVEKHGGQLRCDSVLGQGTQFVIEIPIQQSITLKS